MYDKREKVTNGIKNIPPPTHTHESIVTRKLHPMFSEHCAQRKLFIVVGNWYLESSSGDTGTSIWCVVPLGA